MPPAKKNPQAVLTLGLSVKRLQAVLHNQLEAGFLPHGLTLAQWDVLRTVKAIPGASGARVAHECLVTPQTANLILPRLAEAGLIERRPAPRGRVIETWLTAAGEAKLRLCNAHAQTIEKKLAGHLTASEQLLFLNLLHRCTQALTGEPDPAIRFE